MPTAGRPRCDRCDRSVNAPPPPPPPLLVLPPLAALAPAHRADGAAAAAAADAPLAAAEVAVCKGRYGNGERGRHRVICIYCSVLAWVVGDSNHIAAILTIFVVEGMHVPSGTMLHTHLGYGAVPDTDAGLCKCHTQLAAVGASTAVVAASAHPFVVLVSQRLSCRQPLRSDTPVRLKLVRMTLPLKLNAHCTGGSRRGGGSCILTCKCCSACRHVVLPAQSITTGRPIHTLYT